MRKGYFSVCTKIVPVFFALLFLCGCERRIEWNGGFYAGETEDGRPSGFGRWVGDSDSCAYEGFWKSGLMSGYGTFTCADTCRRGIFSEGKLNGLGQLITKGDTVYTGMWRDGKRDGRGVFTDSLGPVSYTHLTLPTSIVV